MPLSAVTLGVTDITRSAAFYEALGWSLSRMSTSTMAVLTSEAAVALILHTVEDLAAHANVASDGTGFGGIALVIAVRSPEEVHHTLATAARAGANILRPVTQLGFGSHAYFADDDGHVWEIVEQPGFLVDGNGVLFLP